MSILEWFTRSKFKTVSGNPHATPLDMAYVEGLNKGIEIGLSIASEVDKKVLSSVREKAIEEAIRRLNGHD
jgi:hypothetical protein